MRKTIGFIVAALGILIFATMMLVIIPSVQLSKIPPAPGLKEYTEQELRGRRSYVSNGCVYCHSQQPSTHFPDEKRGWGRPSMPGDYAYDTPHLLGTMRTGPDLFNIGARQPSLDWHLTHLYQPRSVAPGSVMPSYPFLFQIKDRAYGADVVVKLPDAYKPEKGVVVATQEALDLVAYLKSLNHTYPVDEEAKEEQK